MFVSSEAEYGSFEALSRLSEDFVHAAVMYGRVIISEKDLPHEEKTIKPDLEVGGTAGGQVSKDF